MEAQTWENAALTCVVSGESLMRSIDLLTGTLILIVCSYILVGVAFIARERYRLNRYQMKEKLPASRAPMMLILTASGPVIAILAGLTGYMINDYAAQRAIQTMTPTISDSNMFANAVADVVVENDLGRLRGAPGPSGEDSQNGQHGKNPNVMKIAAEMPADRPDFPLTNAVWDIDRPNLRVQAGKDGAVVVAGPPGKDEATGKAGAAGKNGAFGIDTRSLFIDAVAAELAAHYADKLRGERGAPGKDGESPTVADVATELVKSHRAELRGEAGPPGKDGRNGSPGVPGNDGLPGKDGKSPSVDAVAAELVAHYADKLRGMSGAPEKKNAESPTIADIATELATYHRAELRGVAGPPGKDGRDGAPGKDGANADEVATLLLGSDVGEFRGPPGRDGKDGVSPDPRKVTEWMFRKYHEQLRGPPGREGPRGNDGLSPRPADVAAILWSWYHEELCGGQRRRIY